MSVDAAGSSLGAVEPAVLRAVRARILDGGGPVTPELIAAAAREAHVVVGGPALARLVEAVAADLLGLGPLSGIADDETVTDIVVNGPSEVYLDRGAGLERAQVRFADDDAVARLARRLVAAAGRRLDEAVPWADARLPDGTRLHAVLGTIAAPGTCLSLRLPRRRRFVLEELVHPQTAELLRAVVASRRSFLVTGGTGTGKTTVLSALLSCVDPEQRLVIVEDCRELRPEHPHAVRLEARPPNVEGAGEVTIADLVRQALRMRPDRLVVGEVRGAEVVALLAALNTGHEGGCGTVHASSPQQLPARIEALAGAAGLPRAAAHSQLAAAVALVVHVSRDRRGQRGVSEIGVLLPSADGTVGVHSAMHARVDGPPQPGPAAHLLRELLA